MCSIDLKCHLIDVSFYFNFIFVILCFPVSDVIKQDFCDKGPEKSQIFSTFDMKNSNFDSIVTRATSV